jgi:predicted HicB family RNase H-like nuclease
MIFLWGYGVCIETETGMQKPKDSAIKLRLSRDLHEKVAVVANKEHRSVNSEIVLALEKHVEAQSPTAKQ